MQEQRDTQTTLTTRDMYRKAVLDQHQLISKQKKEVFEGQKTPDEVGVGVMGVYWSIASLKNLLNIYIHKEISPEGKLINIEEYQRCFDAIDLDFNLILLNPNMSNIRLFMGALNEWQDLLTIYFSDAGLLPKKRVVGSLATEEILKIESLDQLQLAIKRLVPAEHTEQINKYIESEIK